MTRSLALLAVFCAAACSEPETPLILEGQSGACGSVVQGATPDQVECPSACPIAVQAFRVRDTRTCERSSTNYVACISAGGTGRPGAALLDTEDGPIFVDDPAIDCNREDGCAGVSTSTSDRWKTCADTEDEGCDCICQGGECAFDRFVDELGSCGLMTPCEPLTADTEPTVEQLQCYMDALAGGSPTLINMDVPATNHLTGEETIARTVVAANGRRATRVQQLAYTRPASQCDLQEANFFLTCDPEDPIDVNIENEEGLVERVSCTDPRGWVLNCESAEPVCP